MLARGSTVLEPTGKMLDSVAYRCLAELESTLCDKHEIYLIEGSYRLYFVEFLTDSEFAWYLCADLLPPFPEEQPLMHCPKHSYVAVVS